MDTTRFHESEMGDAVRATRGLIGLAVGALLWTTPARLASGEQTQFWRTGFQDAQQESQRTGKPMMIQFGAEWCTYCVRMDKTTFVEPDVVRQLENGWVPVHLDYDTNKELAARFDAQSLPTTVLVDSDGTEIGRVKGYRSPRAFLSELNRARGADGTQDPFVPSRRIARDRFDAPIEQASAAKPVVDKRPSRWNVLSRLWKRNEPEVVTVLLSAHVESDLALQGYCPMTLVETGELVAGKPHHRVAYQGKIYWFADAMKMVKFRRNPTLAAPAFDGLCATTIKDLDGKVEGDPRFAAVHNSTLYLFATAERRSEFQTNVARYVGRGTSMIATEPIDTIRR